MSKQRTDIHAIRARVAASLDASIRNGVAVSALPSVVVPLRPTDPNPQDEDRYARERIMRRI